MARVGNLLLGAVGGASAWLAMALGVEPGHVEACGVVLRRLVGLFGSNL